MIVNEHDGAGSREQTLLHRGVEGGEEDLERKKKPGVLSAIKMLNAARSGHRETHLHRGN